MACGRRLAPECRGGLSDCGWVIGDDRSEMKGQITEDLRVCDDEEFGLQLVVQGTPGNGGPTRGLKQCHRHLFVL